MIKAKFGKTGASFSAALTAAALTLGAMAVPAMAQQRDPAYAAARAAGLIGERPDGYLGIPGTETPELRRIINDVNIKRRAVYAERAQANNATIEQFAFTAGCQAISRTAPGEKYQAPDGRWLTRTGETPVRDSRCIG